MRPDIEAQVFLGSAPTMEAYRKAITMLRQIGFESLARRLGEPKVVPPDHPQALTMSAIDQAERRGWYEALDCIFNFEDVIGVGPEEGGAGDFGAKNKLKDLGFSSEEMEQVE